MKSIVIVQPLKYTDIRQDKLIKSFSEKGYEVHIIYSKENKIGTTKTMYEGILENIKFYSLGTKLPANIPFNYYRNRKINNIIKKINPQIVICRDIFISGFIRDNHNYESYLDICDNFPEVLNCLMKKPLNKIAEKIANYYELKAIKKFKRVIFVSNSSANYVLSKHNQLQKRYCILQNVPNKKHINLKDINKELDFIYIGTINKKIRDIDTVIEAIEYSKSNGFDFKFDIYFFKHQIEIINEYKQVVKLKKLEENIRFYEAVKVEELPKVLNRYKFGLVPHCRNRATDYTIPNKLYDYLQQGMYVITSDNPSMKIFSDELGVTSSYCGGDYKSLANLMMKLSFETTEIKNKKGLELIDSNLNWDLCFSKFYKDIYSN